MTCCILHGTYIRKITLTDMATPWLASLSVITTCHVKLSYQSAMSGVSLSATCEYHVRMPLRNAISKYHMKMPLQSATSKCHLKIPFHSATSKYHMKIPRRNATSKYHMKTQLLFYVKNLLVQLTLCKKRGKLNE